MNLVDVLLMLQKEKSTLDWSRLKEEYSRQAEIIKELEQAQAKLLKIISDLNTCKEEGEESLKKIYANLKKIEENEDPYSIINIINEQYIELEKCKKVVMEIINAKIQKYKEIIINSNEKLKLYSRIYLTILGKNITNVQFFPSEGDIKQLERNAKASQELVSKIYEDLKNELKTAKIDEDKLNLLVELIDKGQLSVTRKNADKVLELLKFLSSRGIIITVKI